MYGSRPTATEAPLQLRRQKDQTLNRDERQAETTEKQNCDVNCSWTYFRQKSDRRSWRVMHFVVGEGELPLEDAVRQGDAERLEQGIERRGVATPRLGHPPAPRVLVVELDLGHDRRVVPLREDWHEQQRKGGLRRSNRS